MQEALEQITISGKVGTVIYENEMNGYCVLRLDTPDGSEISAVGHLPGICPGELINARGVWVSHPQYGEQLQIHRAERSLPTTGEAIYEYLAGHSIRGIGPATAAMIVDRFGNQSLEILENDPQRLTEIKGLSLSRAMSMSESFKKRQGLRRLMEFLSAYSIRAVLAMRLYRFYGDAALEIVRHNPYIIASAHVGGRFSEADSLALSLGYEGDSPERIESAVIFELIHNSGNGHCFIPFRKLAEATARLIGVPIDSVEECIDVLADAGEAVRESIAGQDAVYLRRLHEAESHVAERIAEMADTALRADVNINAIIESLERAGGITYAPMQRETLRMASERRVLVITGGPGTGKTTSVRAILSLFDNLGLETELAAPTGRAAKRMSELTGREARTVHRLLEATFSEETDELIFKRDSSDPLKCDAIILDECSMVDIALMSALLDAMPSDCRLIMVGDADQLPSVGPGSVFRDIIRSGAVRTVRLTEIFRQSEGSQIVRSAHMINHGELPNLADNKGDFFFMRRRSAEAACETITELISKRLPEKMGIERHDIQILTPTRLHSYGTASLNKRLQANLNPAERGKKERLFGETLFRIGDKVMQIRNNYDIMWESADGRLSGVGIYNGDIGIILGIDESSGVFTIDFDNRIAEYGLDMLAEIEHAWAMTVHKSQGSEYRAVILCLMKGTPNLLTRGVLYTAVTRARELLVIVGDDEAVVQMVGNSKSVRRYSGLRARLAGAGNAR